MPCYHPKPVEHYVDEATGVKAVRFKSENPNGGLPCRRCIGCRLDHAQQWNIRCYHESQMHTENMFVTLTYDDHNLPKFGDLKHEHFQKFIRALRQSSGKKISYYMCGEYGPTCPKHQTENCPECGPIHRPHYHALIFGYDYPDKTFAYTRNDNRYYHSDTLAKHWPHGNADISEVTYKSAGYVARYILDKQIGDTNHLYDVHYQGDLVHTRQIPYTRMSLKPAIGKTFYEKYNSDIFPHGYVVLPNGKQARVPQYYMSLYEQDDPLAHERLKWQYEKYAQDDTDSTPERLADRKIYKVQQIDNLKRNRINA